MVRHRSQTKTWSIDYLLWVWCSTACEIFLDQGSNLCLLLWEHGVLTAEPLGKSWHQVFNVSLRGAEDAPLRVIPNRRDAPRVDIRHVMPSCQHAFHCWEVIAQLYGTIYPLWALDLILSLSHWSLVSSSIKWQRGRAGCDDWTFPSGCWKSSDSVCSVDNTGLKVLERIFGPFSWVPDEAVALSSEAKLKLYPPNIYP